MTNYPGQPPQPSDGEPNQGQPSGTPQDGPTGGPTETQSDTEPTQPVGYWERQAAEQARAHEAQQWAQPPDPTTAYPQQPGQYNQPPQGQPYQQQPYQQPYGGPYDQPYGQAPGYPPAAGQSGPPPAATRRTARSRRRGPTIRSPPCR